MKKAYELAQSCHFIIALFGSFMQSASGPLPITYEMISRDMIPSYPYWFYVKIYPELALLDRKAANLILSKEKSKRK